MNPELPFGPDIERGESAITAVTFSVRGWRITVGTGVTWTHTTQPGQPPEVLRIRSRQEQFTSTSPSLPSAANIVAACDPLVGMMSVDAILVAVGSLAQLAAEDHAHPIGHTDNPDQLAVDHDETIELLDDVIAQQLPHECPDATVHTETLAPVISRLVTLVVTRKTLSRQSTQPDRTLDELDTAIADLRAAYDQLIADLTSGRRRLPRYQTAPAV
ncbi:DUF4254 domain-containing protein [Nocardia brasiliensis]